MSRRKLRREGSWEGVDGEHGAGLRNTEQGTEIWFLWSGETESRQRSIRDRMVACLNACSEWDNPADLPKAFSKSAEKVQALESELLSIASSAYAALGYSD